MGTHRLRLLTKFQLVRDPNQDEMIVRGEMIDKWGSVKITGMEDCITEKVQITGIKIGDIYKL